MTTHLLPVRLNQPTNDELHALVYRSIVGLTIWLVLSVWVLFSRGEYERLTLTVITLFFVVLVGIPVLLWLTWRRNADPNEGHKYVAPFTEWTSHSRTGPAALVDFCSLHDNDLWDDNFRPDVFIHGTAPRLMSALGQKQTCAVQEGMSALPPNLEI